MKAIFPKIVITEYLFKDVKENKTMYANSFSLLPLIYEMYDGCYSYANKTIYLRKQSFRAMYCTTWHELTHWIFGRNELLAYTVENIFRILLGLKPKTFIYKKLNISKRNSNG